MLSATAAKITPANPPFSPLSNTRLERLRHILACPQCGSDLELEANAATCRGGGHVFPIRKGKIYFVEVPERTDEMDWLKARVKHFLGRYYYTVGREIFAPTFPFNYAGWVRRFFNPREQIVVDAGCGNNRIDRDIICADLFDYEVVDIVCDLTALPFKPNSVDGFTTRSVLEHVHDPQSVVRGFYLRTRPGGVGLHQIPFLFPFHASPNDFHRYTHEGLRVLFKDWSVIQQANVTGPITLFLLWLIEFTSIVLSFGREGFRKYVYLVCCALLFPLKYLDVFFVNRPSFLSLAPTIVTVIHKPDETKTA